MVRKSLKFILKLLFVIKDDGKMLGIKLRKWNPITWGIVIVYCTIMAIKAFGIIFKEEWLATFEK